MNLRHGSKVWLEDRDSSWLAAEVLDSDGNRFLLVTDSGMKVFASPEKLFPRDADEEEHGGFEDMTRLAYLNEPGVLFNLRRRYALNDIYTYTGSILIAVNPFTQLPHLYDSHMMEQYKGAPLGELSPHVFAIADASYSGESGAGKTETTKLIMQYLTFVGGRAAVDDRTVEQQVLEFVEIQFDSNGRISGAAIRTYLLERSRVVQIMDPERNYHCFYQLCACERDAEKYKLGHPSHFHYLNQSKIYELDGVSNAEENLKTRRAMDIVGISHEDQEAIFRVLAEILHLGNIEFSPGKEHDSSGVKDEKSRFHMQMAADLFMPVGGCPRLGHLFGDIKLQLWQYNAFGGVDKQKESYVSNEEAKKVEISKLQKMLEALNLELDAAKLAKINECNKNAVLQNQFELSVKEKSALKRELVAVDELRKENAQLKVPLDAFEKKCTTLELELMNAQKGRDETMEKLRESEQKCSQLEQNEKRLEEKLLNLEDENHVLRQKALSTPLKSNRPGFAKSISEESPTPTKLIAPFTLSLPDSRRSNKLTAERQQVDPVAPMFCLKSYTFSFGHPAISAATHRCSLASSSLALSRGPPSSSAVAASLVLTCAPSFASRHNAKDNYEFLSKCIKENLGFKNGKPIAARIIYKCLLHWHSFESDRTTIFDSIIKGTNEVLKGPKSPLKFIGYDDGVAHVEAKYPAILFKQQLTACVEKIFGLLRDNLKKDLSPLLGSCIQAPKTGRGVHGGKSSRFPGGIPQQSSSGQWSNIVKFLDSLMSKLRQNHEVAVLGVTLAQWSTMEGDSCRVGSHAMEVTVLAKRQGFIHEVDDAIANLANAFVTLLSKEI
ncbi:hypothetical protein JHK86_048428 [Glycine max]|nr:hypothetical protein JHK86_048428 [Glycine max]